MQEIVNSIGLDSVLNMGLDAKELEENGKVYEGLPGEYMFYLEVSED